MKQCFYINHENYQQGDSLKAFKFAVFLCQKDKSIDTINLLVYQKNQYNPFISELGISQKQFKNHTFPNSRVKVHIHTVRTFNPGNLLVGHENCEVLIAIGVPPKSFERFIDASCLKYWIIVPWTKIENMSFLAIHEAIDIETNKSIKMDFNIDNHLKGAINWLKQTSYPNAGFVHPNDELRLKQMANAIAHYSIDFESDALIHFCINNGILETSAIKIANYFEKAKQRKFSTNEITNYPFLKQMMIDCF